MSDQKPVALIVGGSSGLGLELARALKVTHQIWITGRKNPNEAGVSFYPLPLDRVGELENRVKILLSETLGPNGPKLPIDLVIFAAGFYQNQKIDELSFTEMASMMQVSVLAPAILLSELLRRQEFLPGFIAITSTTQWTARGNEPLYAAGKAGLGMLAKCLSLDDRLKKTLVAGPGGMSSGFWRDHLRDLSKFLDPKWVAEQILEQFANQTTTYRAIRIPRDPPSVELVEERV